MTAKQPKTRKRLVGLVEALGRVISADAEFEGEVENLTPMSQVKVEDVLASCSSALLALINHIRHGVVLVDVQGQVFSANDVAVEMLGAELDDGMLPAGFVSVDDAIIEHCVNGKKVEDVERSFKRADGSTSYFSVSAAPITNCNDQTSLVLLIIRDITESKELELQNQRMLEELKRRQEVLECLLQNVPAGVLLLDSELRIVTTNGFYTEYLDNTDKWHPCVKIDEVLPEAEACGLMGYLRQVLETGQPVTARMLPYDGLSCGRTYWSGSAVPVELETDGETSQGVALILVDVTEEVAGRERLRELTSLAEQRAAELEMEKARLRTIIESTPVPLVVCDTNRNVIAYNSAARDLADSVGAPELLVKGHKIGALHDAQMLDANNQPLEPGRYPIFRSLKGETCTGETLRLKLCSGQEMTFSTNCAPFHGSDGKIAGIVAAVVDITERVRSEDQIRDVYLREHAIAQKLQSCFLPQDFPEINGFDFAQLYKPALDEAMIGGDFYDVFRIADGSIGIVMADVAGKGLKAAVYTAMTKYMLRGYAFEGCPPNVVLEKLNDALSGCTPPEVFVTLFYGVLDTKTRTLIYANAGHEQPIYLSAKSGKT